MFDICFRDPNTIFRGNSLASKLVDELMKVSGPHYLRSTLKPVIDAVLAEKKPCEVDPLRLEKPEEAASNLENLVVSLAFKRKFLHSLVCSIWKTFVKNSCSFAQVVI
jgi:GTPase-activator protein for Ras-like GTPase